ncbi:MAG: reductive dehalogenase [Dehalogenimonas sp.]
MSKFHSIITRRDFMKSLGLAGASLGTLGLTAPALHDLDEAIASDTAKKKRAWWVKEVDTPTVEIDWSMIHRHHGFHSLQSGAILARYIGLEEQAKLSAQNAADTKTGLQNNTPGLTLRARALSDAASGEGHSHTDWTQTFGPTYPERLYSSGYSKSPELYGVPRWEGTPEENFKMMKAVFRMFGASDVGTQEWDENHKKLVGLYGDNISQSYFPYEGKTTWPPPDTVIRPVVFGNQPKFSLDLAKGVLTIPNVPLWSISYTIPQSNEMFRTGPISAIAGAANNARYCLRQNLRARTQMFLKNIGYQSANDTPYRYFPAGAGSQLSGLVENGRHTNVSISPEHGSTIGIFELHTDLPIQSTKPIDAGIWKFCATCGVCAENCPSGAIVKKGQAEPSWDPPASSVTPKHPPLPGLGFSPMGEGESEYFKTGRKTYWSDMILCSKYRSAAPTGCRFCNGSCVFNQNKGSMIHDIVRGTISTTSLFNGFFAQMEKTFGYGPKGGDAIEEFWDMDLPAYGYSTDINTYHGGYR